jgi:hypothetical protein
MIARAPVRPTAAAIRSGWKYISTLVVTPLRSISADAAVIATSTSSRSAGLARPHDLAAASGPAAALALPRNSTIGACEWAFTSPGAGRRESRRPRRPPRRRLRGRPDPADPAVGDVEDGVGITVPARSPTTTARAVKRCSMVSRT